MKKLLAVTMLGVSLTLAGCAGSSLSLPTAQPKGQQTADYKITAAGGIVASITPGNAKQSEYRYAFGIDLKNAQAVKSLKIERLNKDGSRTLVFDDSAKGTTVGTSQQQSPNNAQSYIHVAGNEYSLIAQSQTYNMTPEQAPWLYRSGTTQETYVFTIKDLQGKETVINQRTSIPSSVKKTYLQFFNHQ
ncbi:hypothetical protein [Moraxella marmotae]|uniref:hypothetical protein n=1 Tax=Moraxella marmotae TaxID=3344520 RepID=UPI0035F28F6C